MAVELYDGTDHDGLFDLLGKAIYAFNVLNTARKTTVPTEVLDTLLQFETLAAPTSLQNSTIIGIQPGLASWQQSGQTLAAALQTYCQQYLIETVALDTPLQQKTLRVALLELIRQMVATSDSVDASAITVAVTPSGSNTGNGKLIASTKRGDGLVQEHALAETITVTVTSDGSASASLTIVGTAAVDPLSQDWPGGSGAGGSITSITPAASLLSNGDMELEADVANSPDDWIINIGTIGTTVKMTDVEIQTIAMTGTPSAGSYTITHTGLDSKVQTTGPLAYNASSSDVQAELRALVGLSAITVVESGTSPDLTHTITFDGAGGNQTQLTSTNRTTGGTLTHATTTGGTSQVYSGGKSLQIVGDGSQLTTLYQPLTSLKPETVYVMSLWAVSDTTPAAGVVVIDLVDGIGGSVIADKQGVNNSLTFDADDLGTGSTWKHLSELVSGECMFRTPTVIPPAVYLRIRLTTAITNTRIMTLDNLALVEAKPCYVGGPVLAAFTGSTRWKNKDTFAVVVTNDRAGTLQVGCNRMLGLQQLDLLLPSDSSASETIPDSVVG